MTGGGTDAAFVPPFPPRPDRLPPWRQPVRDGRRNSLLVLPRIACERDLLATRVLAREVVLCNSPASVQEVFVDRHEVFQHKSPQHRFALIPLLGGRALRQRRAALAGAPALADTSIGGRAVRRGTLAVAIPLAAASPAATLEAAGRLPTGPLLPGAARPPRHGYILSGPVRGSAPGSNSA
ncbi:MAG: putative cytochrome [Belnapia sp.]|nr:putative cytochrome [Belnapia sp.]